MYSRTRPYPFIIFPIMNHMLYLVATSNCNGSHQKYIINLYLPPIQQKHLLKVGCFGSISFLINIFNAWLHSCFMSRLLNRNSIFANEQTNQNKIYTSVYVPIARNNKTY